MHQLPEGFAPETGSAYQLSKAQGRMETDHLWMILIRVHSCSFVAIIQANRGIPNLTRDSFILAALT
jgi:hypothetical protein